jgi:N-methylhydantoinase A/oxoprolinase/acetone carboxylase beta subunit
MIASPGDRAGPDDGVTMNMLINIDNGGTLTDVCVWDGAQFTFTKTLTTPFDLSQCLFDGITKASGELYGEPDLQRALHDTRHIRYSTTQGTNALVERKGPELGLLVDDASIVEELRAAADEEGLFEDLLGARIAAIDTTLPDDALEQAAVSEVNALINAGATRIVVAAGEDRGETESRLRAILLRKFPRHLLGSVPLLYSWDFVDDSRRDRRVWSALLNSFLHPVIERFLYSTEERLRAHQVQNPLLVYRNDGASSRVAKSVALKTYSSGPRGGLEGTRAIAEAYGFARVLMVDVGGTTTDVGVVDAAGIATARRGRVEGAPVSYPLSAVHSSGVGGSSIIQVVDGRIQVGPESVGAAPGPACFGFGGTRATITDVNLLLGILDAGTYLDGGFALDAARAEAVVRASVADPLGISLEEALVRMEQAYFERMAEAFGELADGDTTLAAFGGAGPMSACGSARLVGIRRIIVPRLAAVFSAFGIGFSDIGRTYETAVAEPDAAAFETQKRVLTARAERDMFQEGYPLGECRLVWSVERENEHGEHEEAVPYDPVNLPTPEPGHALLLRLDVAAALPQARIPRDVAVPPSVALPVHTRQVRSSAERVDDVPVFRLDDLQPGATAAGPAIVEGPFFTARVLDGWSLSVTAAGDVLLEDVR